MSIPRAGSIPAPELKLNSYDLGVDIELADAVQRLRFEHPEVRAVVIRSGKDNVFCAGANIGALARSAHGDKVNFCKFTNETPAGDRGRVGEFGPALPRGCERRGGRVAAYELAAACDWITLIDDRRSAVSLPEVAAARGVARHRRFSPASPTSARCGATAADLFCTAEEGARGQRAVDWRLVDEIAPPSSWDKRIAERAAALVATSDRPADGKGIALPPLERDMSDAAIAYPHVRVALDRPRRRAEITVLGPQTPPATAAGHSQRRVLAAGGGARARRRDPAFARKRAGVGHHPSSGSEGDPSAMAAMDTLLDEGADDWFRPRNPALLETRAEAHRHDLAQPSSR